MLCTPYVLWYNIGEYLLRHYSNEAGVLKGVFIMFVRVTKSPTAKFSKVYLVEGYRDESGKSKQRILKCYGNLEELEAADPDILSKLKAEAKQMPLTPNNQVEMTLNMLTKNNDSSLALNYGYFFLEAIYNELKIPAFFKKYKKKYRFTYDIDEIVRLLTFSRILDPQSKLSTVQGQERFFDRFAVSLEDVYRSLGVLNDLKEQLQACLHKEISQQYQRDCSLVFYDVTNYYFETEMEDDLKKKGLSKERKLSPIVQMGLFIDNNGIPIAYKLFSGNTHDSKTLKPILDEMKLRYGLGKIIVTADKGLNSGANLAYLAKNKDGYIVSQKIRGTSKEFIKQVLDEESYVYNSTNTFKIKSFFRERSVKDEEGNTIQLNENVICFWSKDYDDREKHKREKLEERIQDFIDHPSKFNASNAFGIKKYMKVQQLDKETGEIEKLNPVIEFNQEKYNKDRSLDGYYVIITNELDYSSHEIIEKYRGLWKIEESFKVLKSDLEGRPVYVKNETHVEGHFLICFLALTISRILEYKLGQKYSVSQIQQSLKNANCIPLEKGIYLLTKQSEVFHEIEKAFGVSLDCKYTPLENLRRYKKRISTQQ